MLIIVSTMKYESNTPICHSEERSDEESLAAATCPVSARNCPDLSGFTTFRMTSEDLFSREFGLLYFLQGNSQEGNVM